jgi:hypothetical protein
MRGVTPLIRLLALHNPAFRQLQVTGLGVIFHGHFAKCIHGLPVNHFA